MDINEKTAELIARFSDEINLWKTTKQAYLSAKRAYTQIARMDDGTPEIEAQIKIAGDEMNVASVAHQRADMELRGAIEKIAKQFHNDNLNIDGNLAGKFWETVRK